MKYFNTDTPQDTVYQIHATKIDIFYITIAQLVTQKVKLKTH